MRKMVFTLLSAALVAVFCAEASAMDVTVKLTGEYYVAGLYLDRTTVKKDTATDGPSTAFFFQRLRMKTDFMVAPGLALIGRFDVMERSWGATRSAPGAVNDSASYGTRAENENFVVDWMYVSYRSPIGTFNAGVMNTGTIGTVFGDNSTPNGRIMYINTFGPVTVAGKYTKVKEGSRSAVNATGVADADNDNFGIDAFYKMENMQIGMAYYYYRYAENRPVANYKKSFHLLTPYAQAKWGPVTLQAEFNYAWGKEREYDSGPLPDVDMQNISGWVDAVADFRIFYVGGTFAYVSGDDPGTTDKTEGGTLSGGIDWNPCLIMWNYDRTYWAGNLDGHDNARQSSPMSNAWFFQGRAGVRPTDRLDIMGSVAYANADRKPTSAWVDNAYGWEIDLTATYRITQNLSYMLGGGYLFTGKYFKGESDANSIRDDYLVINRLTLTF